MLKIPIEILIIGICAISLVIVILSMYLVLKGTRDHIVSRKKRNTYKTNKTHGTVISMTISLCLRSLFPITTVKLKP
jgi:uncharacterized protein (DUF58 family)